MSKATILTMTPRLLSTPRIKTAGFPSKKQRKIPILCDDGRMLTPSYSSHGLVFFATPHGGGNPTLLAIAKCAGITKAFSSNPPSDFLEHLDGKSTSSAVLFNHWRHSSTKFPICSFYENRGNVSLILSATFQDEIKVNKILGRQADLPRW